VTPAFSVFIPVWNDAEWLGGAIESVRAQTYPHWELVIGDNDSNDDLRALVAAYPDPRIRYKHWRTHVDTYSNFNRTALLCDYDWLQLLSADDRLHPACLERMASRITAPAVSGRRLALVVTACRRVTPEGTPAERRYYGSQRVKRGCDGRYTARSWLKLLAEPGMPEWNIGSIAVARDVLAEMGGFFRPEVGLCSDHDFTLRAAAYGDVAYISAPLLEYTVRGRSDGNQRFMQNRTSGEASTPMGAALLSGLATHRSRRPVAPAEQRMVRAAVARSHLQRAGQHRILPGGRGRRGAVADVARAVVCSPRTLLSPELLLTAAASVVAPRVAVRWGSAALAWRRGREHERAAQAGPIPGATAAAQKQPALNGACSAPAGAPSARAARC